MQNDRSPTFSLEVWVERAVVYNASVVKMSIYTSNVACILANSSRIDRNNSPEFRFRYPTISIQ